MSLVQKKVGLALGSGAARGLAHIGVLKVLEQREIPIHCIAGTSIGALIGALYAAGVRTEALEEIACNMNWRLVTRMFAPTVSSSGFVRGDRIRDFLQALVGDLNIEELEIPFVAVATNIETGQEIHIERGSVVEAIRASISIPVLFTPVRYQEHFLADGGLVNPVPAGVAREMGADIVLAVNVMPPVARSLENIRLMDEPKRSIQRYLTSTLLNHHLIQYIRDMLDGAGDVLKVGRGQSGSHKENGKLDLIDIVTQSTTIMQNEIIKLRLQQEPADLLIEPETGSIALLEFYKAREAIEAGEMEAMKVLSRERRVPMK